jgi:two-component system, chemotaxis family, CheB/CheR fusion protein
MNQSNQPAQRLILQMRRLLRGYALALAALLVATLVRWLIDPYLGPFMPFATYFVVVALVGMFAGVGPALLTMVGGGTIGELLFMPSTDGPLFSEREYWISLAAFYVSCLVLVSMAHRLRSGQSHLMQTIAIANAELARRREAEQVARDSEARLNAIIDNSPLVLFIKDLEGRYLLANRSYYELFDITPEQLLGATDFDRLPDEIARAYWENDLEVLRSGASREFEESIELDGRLRTYLSTKFPLRDESRGIYAVCGISTEITEQKRQQEKLQELDRRKDEFLSMLAHELRNPLAPIVTAAEVLRHTDLDAARRGHAVDVIARQARHLSRLVDDLLDIARINTGRIQLHYDVVELGDLVRACVDSVRPRFRARSIALELRETGAPRIVADAARITQVIDNLLDNACKYTDPGGRVEVVVARDGTHGVVRVRDTGIGIAPSALERVFELFEQVDASLDRSAGGLGLGLNLVKRMVEMHGGYVKAASDGRGRGSEFAVHLPLTEHPVGVQPQQNNPGTLAGTAPTSPPRVSAAQALPEGHSAPRILIVEDNADAAQTLEMLLGSMGFIVRVASNGRSGLALAEAFQPEAAVLDLGLPEMDGYEVARALRERFGASIRLVALTGYGQREYQERSREAGFDVHLVKPPSLNALLEALTRHPAGASAA